MAGAMTFSLGCVLKTELRRRAEVFEVFMLDYVTFGIHSGLIVIANIYLYIVHNANEKSL